MSVRQPSIPAAVAALSLSRHLLAHGTYELQHHPLRSFRGLLVPTRQAHIQGAPAAMAAVIQENCTCRTRTPTGSAPTSCLRCAPAASPTATTPPPPPCTQPWCCCWRWVTACVCVCQYTYSTVAPRRSSCTCRHVTQNRRRHCCWRWVLACVNTR